MLIPFLSQSLTFLLPFVNLIGEDTNNKGEEPRTPLHTNPLPEINPGGVTVPFQDVTKHNNWPLLDVGTCGQRAITLERKRDPSVSNWIDTRILGGVDSDKIELPWITQPIRISTFPGESSVVLREKCGGTLINKRYVVTAAHCCTPHPEANKTEYLVKLNGDARSTDTPIPVEKVIIHEELDGTSSIPVHDICLMRLQKPIEFSVSVQPICLPRDSDWPAKILTGLNVTVAGWGITGPDDYAPSEHLQKVDVIIQDTDVCIKQYSLMDPTVKLYQEYHFCGGTAKQDACVGDSGGPAIYKSDQGTPRYYLLGIVYYGVSCRNEPEMRKEPGIYMRVSNYVSWILDNINE